MKAYKQIVLFILCSFSIYLLMMLALTQVKIGKFNLVYSVVDGSVIKGGDTYKRFNEFDINSKYDLVIMGSSHAYRGYDIRNFEKELPNCYNLGSGSQQINQTYILAQNLINSKNTKRVILEVYPQLFFANTREIESAAYLVANLKQSSIAISIIKNENDLRLYNQFFIRLLKYFDAPIEFSENVRNPYYKGYCSNSDSLKNPQKVKVSLAEFPKNYANVVCNQNSLGYLNLLLQYFKTNNIKVVVCTHFAPIETNKYVYNLFTPLIQEVCDANDVLYFDYTYKNNLPTEYSFYDHSHLNSNGVKAYNKMLISDLKSIGFL